MNENKIGRFLVTREVIQNWREALQVMRHFVVVRVEWRFVNIGEYTAFSELFDPVEEGVETPCYEIILTKTKGKPISVTVKRTEYF